MAEECLICQKPLEYMETGEKMRCTICGKEESSKARCIEGHYVCDACHMAGLDEIFGICLGESGTDPVAILNKMMNLESCHMHGPEHHVMVGAALLTAYANASGALDLEAALSEMKKRGEEVPGGVCGFWGACGAGISTGIATSIITGSTPLGGRAWGLSNQTTSKALAAIGEVGGPRCCKRDSYLSLIEAVKFLNEALDVTMKTTDIRCAYSSKNNQCIRLRCPFYGGDGKKAE